MSCVQRHRVDLDQQKALYAGGVAWTAIAFNGISNLAFVITSCDSDGQVEKKTAMPASMWPVWGPFFLWMLTSALKHIL